MVKEPDLRPEDLRHDLIGYLLGVLDDRETREVDTALASLDPAHGLRRDLDVLRGAFEPLEHDREPFDPPRGLTERTLAFVAAASVAPPPDDARQRSPRPRPVGVGTLPSPGLSPAAPNGDCSSCPHRCRATRNPTASIPRPPTAVHCRGPASTRRRSCPRSGSWRTTARCSAPTPRSPDGEAFGCRRSTR